MADKKPGKASKKGFTAPSEHADKAARVNGGASVRPHGQQSDNISSCLTKLQEVEQEFEQAQELQKTMKSYQASLEISREERFRMHNIRDMIKKKEAGEMPGSLAREAEKQFDLALQ